MPLHVVERQQRLARTAGRLQVKLGRRATSDELAEETGLPIQHVEEALGAPRVSASLSQPLGGEDDGELGEVLAEREAVDPDEEADESIRHAHVRDAVARLPERERHVVERHFGLVGGPLTLDAIGSELGVTRQRVRQLVRRALRRIARELAA